MPLLRGQCRAQSERWRLADKGFMSAAWPWRKSENSYLQLCRRALEAEPDDGSFPLVRLGEIEPDRFTVFRLAGNVEIARDNLAARLFALRPGGDELAHGELGAVNDFAVFDVWRHADGDAERHRWEAARGEARRLMLANAL